MKLVLRLMRNFITFLDEITRFQKIDILKVDNVDIGSYILETLLQLR